MKTVTSYHNELPGGNAPAVEGGVLDGYQESLNRPNRVVRVLLTVVALGGILVLFNNIRATDEGFVTVSEVPSFDEAGGIMGSSRKEAKISRGLTMKGYPPLSVQQEYWEDLQKIDWKEVEADMQALLTDSKECEFL